MAVQFLFCRLLLSKFVQNSMKHSWRDPIEPSVLFQSNFVSIQYIYIYIYIYIYKDINSYTHTHTHTHTHIHTHIYIYIYIYIRDIEKTRNWLWAVDKIAFLVISVNLIIKSVRVIFFLTQKCTDLGHWHNWIFSFSTDNRNYISMVIFRQLPSRNKIKMAPWIIICRR